MSDEDFLSRWSRRKHAVEGSAKAPESIREQVPPSADVAIPAPEEAFDLSTLPPIDSITSLTDISVFLRKGVPLELSRAALRRAWTSDPGIRDFVGLAENAWDFNDPNAMAGFGPLDHSPEQVREMVRKAFGEIDRTADAIPPAEPELPQRSENSDNVDEQVSGSEETVPVTVSEEATSSAASVVGQSSECGKEDSTAEPAHAGPHEMVHRTHGGALPR